MAAQQLQQVQGRARAIQGQLQQVEEARSQGRTQLQQLQADQRTDTSLVQTYREGGVQLQRAIDDARQKGDGAAEGRCTEEMSKLRAQAAELAQRLRNRKAMMEQLLAKDAEFAQLG